MTLVVATSNRHKLVEIERILDGLDCAVEPISAHVTEDPPEETGRTFAENARLKALYYGRLVPHLTVADDSGLAVDGLDGEPGVRSARFGGPTYAEKFDLLYERLRARDALRSPARFVCAVAAAEGGRVVFEAAGTIEGRIADRPAGDGGFGYDPIFYYPPYGCTLAEVSAQRKAAVSHRGHAFRKLRAFLVSRAAAV
ncbi:MAG: RdgB/HAM1 family non-canonical purine NTP pyrophosphatase [Acidobacteria bacterium]|nr:RdgB/HAM1 family non-canonical purine NTP pyrophosphatase [Acidobacteriota bacterium]